MKKVLLLRPMLGIPFKESTYTHNDESGLPPIRQHWKNFIEMLQEYLDDRCKLTVVQSPLWSFNPNIVEKMKPDVVFIPHKIAEQFPVKCESYYYMQTVFPHLFTIDRKGWGSKSEYYSDMQDLTNYDSSPRGFDILSQHIKGGKSKFEQPEFYLDPKYKDYLLFLCQIPHDESIKYHSDITVENALEALCEWHTQRKIEKPLIVKGHPINPQSMSTLFEIVSHYGKVKDKILWCDKVNLHDTISRANRVYCVNSGAGFESLLHRKPVVTFGHADYEWATIRNGSDISLESLDLSYEKEHNSELYTNEFTNQVCNKFVDIAYDSTDIETFNKLQLEG